MNLITLWHWFSPRPACCRCHDPSLMQQERDGQASGSLWAALTGRWGCCELHLRSTPQCRLVSNCFQDPAEFCLAWDYPRCLWRHKVRWLGHAARKPNDVMVKQLISAHFIPGHPRPKRRPHLMWMDTAVHDIGTLGRTLQIDFPRDWANLALYRDVWRGVIFRRGR